MTQVTKTKLNIVYDGGDSQPDVVWGKVFEGLKSIGDKFVLGLSSFTRDGQLVIYAETLENRPSLFSTRRWLRGYTNSNLRGAKSQFEHDVKLIFKYKHSFKESNLYDCRSLRLVEEFYGGG